MAIRSYPWLDGFDYYATDRLTYKWASASNIHVSPTGGRRNSGCITPTGAGYLVSRPFEVWNLNSEAYTPAESFSIAFALIRQTPDAFKVIAESSGNTAEFEFEFTCSGRIGCRQIGGTWFYSDSIIPLGEWCHVFLYIDGFANCFIIALDSQGRLLMSENMAGVDLGWGFEETFLFETWRIESAVCGNWRIDDLYIQTTSWKYSAALGDCRIDALEMIDDDAGSEYAEWTLSAGVRFADVVNQVPENATATTISAQFNCVNSMLPHTPDSIFAVQSNAWTTDLEAGCGVYLNVGANESDFLDVPVSEGGIVFTWEQNMGDPWDVASVNSAVVGVRVSD